MHVPVSPSLTISDKEYHERNILCYKNIPFIETSMITSLGERLKWTSVLKLDFCNLTEDQIETIANLLIYNDSVTEVSVNGNPNKAQNFNLLLHGTHIRSLSLKFCSIDSSGTEKICKELYDPFETLLIHLNLSSNYIRNEGVQHIVWLLRLNRTLISLNLADNKIYDKGCWQLMLALQKFPLNFEEIVIRRRIKFALQRKNVSFNSTNISLKDETSLKHSKKHSKASTLSASQTDLTRNKINFEKSSLLNHPFMWDPNEESEESDLYCQGNDTLINLNLSYNKITHRGLNAIIEMLHYQINNYSCDRGISRISTEGNVFNDYCEEHILNKLKELVGIKTKKSSSESKKKSHLNLRKRS